MDARFGARYAGSVAADLAISSLGSRTINESLAAGVPPKRVWEAVCEAVEVPVAERH